MNREAGAVEHVECFCSECAGRADSVIRVGDKYLFASNSATDTLCNDPTMAWRCHSYSRIAHRIAARVGGVIEQLETLPEVAAVRVATGRSKGEVAPHHESAPTRAHTGSAGGVSAHPEQLSLVPA